MTEEFLKLTSYFGERDRVQGRFFSEALMDALERDRVTTSILLRAIGGFGLRHRPRGDQTLTMSEDPSVMAVAVDTRSRIERLAPRIADLQATGMVTVERAGLVRGDIVAHDLRAGLHEATKLTIYVGRHERVFRVPAYLAICDLLRRRGVAGASVLLGVDGMHHGERERARFFDRNLDVPTMVLAVGDEANIRRVLPELGALLVRPMITIERVQLCKRDGELLARPHQLPATDASGHALWQKLMIYTSESDRHAGEPVHRGILRRLRATQASGATTLRGVWGFRGDREPHGDRFWQLGRRVPVVTVLVDTPDRIAASFGIIDEMTAEHGLVTAELIPALAHASPSAPRHPLHLARHEF